MDVPNLSFSRIVFVKRLIVEFTIFFVEKLVFGPGKNTKITITNNCVFCSIFFWGGENVTKDFVLFEHFFFKRLIIPWFQIPAQLAKIGGPDRPKPQKLPVSKLFQMTDLEDKLLRRLILEPIDLVSIVGRNGHSPTPGAGGTDGTVIPWKMLLALPGELKYFWGKNIRQI